MYSHSRACIVLGCIIVLVVLCRCDNQHLYVVPPGGWKSPQSILQFLMVAGLLSGTLLNGSLSTSEFYGVWCSGFGAFVSVSWVAVWDVPPSHPARPGQFIAFGRLCCVRVGRPQPISPPGRVQPASSRGLRSQRMS